MKLYATTNYSKLTLGELLSSENPAIRRNATGILKQLQKTDLYYTYKNAEDYQNHLRKGGKIHDNLIVDGILFTQDEYDMGGKEISYGNRKKSKSMFIETENRYGPNGTKDAIVYIEDMACWRNGINYIE